MDYLKEKEKKGEIIVIRPEYDLAIKKMENNVNELNRVYNHGRDVANKFVERIKEFIKK